jgi:hypothetical protein
LLEVISNFGFALNMIAFEKTALMKK